MYNQSAEERIKEGIKPSVRLHLKPLQLSGQEYIRFNDFKVKEKIKLICKHWLMF